MPRTLIRPVCSLRALLVPPLIQLVQSLHASSLYSTHVLLVGTNFPADATAGAVSERLGPLLHTGSLAGPNFPADATACAVSKRLGSLLNPGSLAGMNCPTDDRVEDAVAGDLCEL